MQTLMPLVENQARAQWRLLNHEGFWTQVHAQSEDGSKLVSRELVCGEDKFVDWAREFNGKGNLYVGRNPRDKAGNIIRATSVTLDIDPIRGKGTASSDEAHCGAIRVAQSILSRYGGGNLCSSGNGALVIWPVEGVEGDQLKPFEQGCKAFEESLRKDFETNEIRIDATYDLARLLRVLGSENVKGKEVSGKGRIARFLHVPFRAKQFRIRQIVTDLAHKQSVSVAVPVNPSGDFNSRSEADFALALKCRVGGLSAADTLAALAAYSFRPERTDDHHRIVGKVFADGMLPGVPGLERLSESPKLWTPRDPVRSSGEGLSTGRNSSAIGTGFKWLDDKLYGGWRGGVVYAIEGATNTGKSSFLCSVVRNVCEGGGKALLVTTEANIEEVVQRYLSSGTNIPTATICSGRLSESQQRILADYKETFRKHSLFVHYTVNPNQELIKSFIDDVHPDILVWDYFQHFETGSENRQVQLGSLARWFESTAISCRIPIVVGAQLHRVLNFKDGGKISPSTMDHVKDCKTINDVAKTVIVLKWDWAHIPDGDGCVSIQLDLQKNKGPLGYETVVLDRGTARFSSI